MQSYREETIIQIGYHHFPKAEELQEMSQDGGDCWTQDFEDNNMKLLTDPMLMFEIDPMSVQMMTEQQIGETDRDQMLEQTAEPVTEQMSESKEELTHDNHQAIISKNLEDAVFQDSGGDQI